MPLMILNFEVMAIARPMKTSARFAGKNCDRQPRPNGYLPRTGMAMIGITFLNSIIFGPAKDSRRTCPLLQTTPPATSYAWACHGQGYILLIQALFLAQA